ncbi:MAG: MBL fold metallo-hydrolase [Schwartzia sp. (in: firmicutes)]
MEITVLPGGLQIYRYSMPGIDSGMYVAVEGEEALVVDPHVSENMMEALEACGVKKLLVFLTHEHFDHISGVNVLRARFDCHVVCTKTAAGLLPDPNRNLAKFWDVLLMDKSPEEKAIGETVKDEEYSCQADEAFDADTLYRWHGHEIKAVVAPGHSKGSALFFLDETALFSGDSLVNGAGVICRLPGGKWKSFEEKALPLLSGLADDLMVFPGHGSADTLKNLRKYLVKFGTPIEEPKP